MDRDAKVFIVSVLLAGLFFMGVLAAIVHRVDLGVLWGWM
jgi:hypothetical protein